MYEQIKAIADQISTKTGNFRPEVGVILGSGLGNFAEAIEIEQTLDYCDIEGFPTSTVEGHSGRLIMGHIAGRKVVAMQG